MFDGVSAEENIVLSDRVSDANILCTAASKSWSDFKRDNPEPDDDADDEARAAHMLAIIDWMTDSGARKRPPETWMSRRFPQTRMFWLRHFGPVSKRPFEDAFLWSTEIGRARIKQARREGRGI